MTDGYVKIYKNPNRNKQETYQSYVPQYQLEGKNPANIGIKSLLKPNVLPLDNPRAIRNAIRQPYAESIPSPIGKGSVPNIGNNMEHTWSSVNGDIIDDLSIDLSVPMIDNNDYVSEELPTLDETKSVFSKTFTSSIKKEQPSEDDLLSVVQKLEDSSYLLIVDGVSVCSGPLSEIQEQASSLVFGEHELCDGNPIPVEDILILKKIKVKIGLFLE